MRPPFAICGKARAGKTTIAERFTKLVQAYGGNFTYGETSSELVKMLSERTGLTVAQILEEKEKHRPALIALGNEACSEDPAALARRVIEAGHSVVTGVRRLGELEKLKEDFPGLITIWVERNVNPVGDNREIESVHCDILIDNNGPLESVDLAIQTGLCSTLLSEIAECSLS